MHASNRSIPNCSVIPEIGYRDVGEAVDWLRDHFGFVERLRIGNHRCQMTFGDGALVVVQNQAACSQSTMIRVQDIEVRFRKTKEAGLKIVRALAEHPYGERQFTVCDFAGHFWTFTETVFDADPASWGGRLSPSSSA